MTKVSYERMIENDWDCIIKGSSIHKLNKIKRLKGVSEGIPMSFQRLNNLLFKYLDCLEYIEFWKTIEIYKVEN